MSSASQSGTDLPTVQKDDASAPTTTLSATLESVNTFELKTLKKPRFKYQDYDSEVRSDGRMVTALDCHRNRFFTLYGGRICMYDTKTGKSILSSDAPYSIHPIYLARIYVDENDPTQIQVNCNNGESLVWDTREKKVYMDQEKLSWASSLNDRRSDNGRYILTTRGLWDTHNTVFIGPRIKPHWTHHPYFWLRKSCVSRNGKRVVTVADSTKKNIRFDVWQYCSARNEWVHHTMIRETTQGTKPSFLKMSRDGTIVAYCEGSKVFIYKLYSIPVCGEGVEFYKMTVARQTNEHTCSVTHTDRVNDIEFSPDGSRLASGDVKGRICIWNTDSGSVQQQCVGHTAPIASLAFGSDNETLVSATKRYQNTGGVVRFWKVQCGQSALYRPILFQVKEAKESEYGRKYPVRVPIRKGPGSSYPETGYLVSKHGVIALEERGHWVRHSQGWSPKHGTYIVDYQRKTLEDALVRVQYQNLAQLSANVLNIDIRQSVQGKKDRGMPLCSSDDESEPYYPEGSTFRLD